MASRPSLDDAIDRLYQRPLEEFVAARTELARQASREDGAAIRSLPKPNVVAWSLNQLYWGARPVFDRLVSSAARLRSAQAEALMGRPSDVRSADEGHRKALGAAIEEGRAILARAGHPASPDTLRLLAAALQALPWKDRPGRLARPPGPVGFEAFAGLPVEATRGPATETTPAPRRPGPAAVPPAGKRPPEPRAASAREREATQRHRAQLDAARTRSEQAHREELATSARMQEAEIRLEAARAAEQRAREAEQRARREWEQARAVAADAETSHREAVRAHEAARRAFGAAESARKHLEQKVESG